jgi:hypothetical protein
LGGLFYFIEECKADVLAMFAAQYITNKEKLRFELEKSKDKSSITSSSSDCGGYTPVLSERDLEEIYITHFASLFRSIRFGQTSAHGCASLIQLNWFIKEKAMYILFCFGHVFF